MSNYVRNVFKKPLWLCCQKDKFFNHGQQWGKPICLSQTSMWNQCQCRLLHLSSRQVETLLSVAIHSWNDSDGNSLSLSQITGFEYYCKTSVMLRSTDLNYSRSTYTQTYDMLVYRLQNVSLVFVLPAFLSFTKHVMQHNQNIPNA